MKTFTHYLSKQLVFLKQINTTYKYSWIILMSIVLLASCTKDEGYGGLASISGKVYAYDFNKDGVEIDQGYAGDIVVYLGAKGNSEIIERGRTSHDGSFKFSQLRKGNYEVWVYSDCEMCVNGHQAVIKEAKVSSKKSKVDLGIFEIYL